MSFKNLLDVSHADEDTIVIFKLLRIAEIIITFVQAHQAR